jgi:hypothetical protein
MLEFAGGSFERGFWGPENGGKCGLLRSRQLLEPRGRPRSAVSSHQPPAKERSLDDIEHVFGWGLPSDRFDFFQATCTQRIETDAVLSVLDMLRQFRFEQDKLLFGEETFKERVLGPGAKAAQDFVHFCAPAVIRDVVGDDIAGGLVGRCYFCRLHLRLQFPIS